MELEPTYFLGDTPTFTAALAQDDTNAVPNLFGATVYLVLRDPGAAVPAGQFLCQILDGGTTGRVAYTVTGIEVSYPGQFLAQFVVTYADATQETFPSPSDNGSPTFIPWTVLAPLSSPFAPVGDGLTLGDVIQNVRERITTSNGKLNVLSGPLDANPATIQLQTKYPDDKINVGSTLSIGLECCLVWEKDDDRRTITLQRGFAGSRVLAHRDGELIRVDPTFTDYAIFTCINQELAALPGEGLFRVAFKDITSDNIAWGYDLADDIIDADALDVSWKVKSSVNYRADLYSYRIDLGVPRTDWPSGSAIFFNNGRPMPGQPFRVTYKAAFNPLRFLGEPVAITTGLPDSAVDILEIGAAIRVTSGRAVARADTSTQKDSRRAGEVRVGEILASSQDLARERLQRIAVEVAKLQGQYAPRLLRRSVL